MFLYQGGISALSRGVGNKKIKVPSTPSSSESINVCIYVIPITYLIFYLGWNRHTRKNQILNINSLELELQLRIPCGI